MSIMIRVMIRIGKRKNMGRFKAGDKAFIVEKFLVNEVQILSGTDSFYQVCRLGDGAVGSVMDSVLFATEEEARQSLEARREKRANSRRDVKRRGKMPDEMKELASVLKRSEEEAKKPRNRIKTDLPLPKVSAGSFGGRLKKYREMRGYSMKELGLFFGFSEGSASLNIAQYEQNARMFRQAHVREFADILKISPLALHNTDFSTQDGMMHALFDMEEYHDFQPSVRQTENGPEYSIVVPAKYAALFEEWIREREKSLPDSHDTKEDAEEKERDYILWKAGYSSKKKKKEEKQ